MIWSNVKSSQIDQPNACWHTDLQVWIFPSLVKEEKKKLEFCDLDLLWLLNDEKSNLKSGPVEVETGKYAWFRDENLRREFHHEVNGEQNPDRQCQLLQ